MKPKYILQNSSEFIFTVVQANTSKLAREIVLNQCERAPLFSNDKSVESPIVKFRVKDHGWSDIINLEKPMLIFIALKRKIVDKKKNAFGEVGKNDVYTIKEKNSGFKVEQFTNFNI